MTDLLTAGLIVAAGCACVLVLLARYRRSRQPVYLGLALPVAYVTGLYLFILNQTGGAPAPQFAIYIRLGTLLLLSGIITYLMTTGEKKNGH